MCELEIPQPKHAIAMSIEEAVEAAEKISYPVVVRPSYVLGGRAMVIAYDRATVEAYSEQAREFVDSFPILIDQFLEDAIEIDVDALSDGESVYIGGIMEHIEHAGVHSGDSSCVLPSFQLLESQLEIIRDYTAKLARALNVVGLMNVQFAVPSHPEKGERRKVYVLEVNPRASRTVPYVSKATGVPLAKLAALVMAGAKLSDFDLPKRRRMEDFYAVKSPVFPFNLFRGVDTILGPEMKSTGEVMGVGVSFGQSFAKAQLAAGQKIPTEGTAFLSVADQDKPDLVPIARQLAAEGFSLVATGGTADFLREKGLSVETVYKVNEGRPNVVDLIKTGKIQLILNTPLGRKSFYDERAIRRAAIRHQIPCITTIEGATAAVSGVEALQQHSIEVRSLQDMHERFPMPELRLTAALDEAPMTAAEGSSDD